MNINLETKPQITIDLDPVLEAYCRFVFNTPVKQNQIVLHRRHAVGKIINASWSVSDLPVSKPFCKNPVTFILPQTKQNLYALRYRFYHVTKLAEHQIQDAIDATFDLWVKRAFERGYNLNMEQDMIAECLLRGLNTRKTVANIDAIIKRDYRKRRSTEEKRFELLLHADI